MMFKLLAILCLTYNVGILTLTPMILQWRPAWEISWRTMSAASVAWAVLSIYTATHDWGWPASLGCFLNVVLTAIIAHQRWRRDPKSVHGLW